MNPPLDVFPVEQAVVQVYPTKSDMSYAAAVQAGRILQRAISRRGRARVIIATGLVLIRKSTLCGLSLDSRT